MTDAQTAAKIEKQLADKRKILALLEKVPFGDVRAVTSVRCDIRHLEKQLAETRATQDRAEEQSTQANEADSAAMTRREVLRTRSGISGGNGYSL